MAVSWGRPENEVRLLVADRSLYLDKSESIVLEEDDARCAFLLISKGREIPADYVHRHNLVEVDGKIYQQGSEPKPVEDAPSEAKAEDDPAAGEDAG